MPAVALQHRPCERVGLFRCDFRSALRSGACAVVVASFALAAQEVAVSVLGQFCFRWHPHTPQSGRDLEARNQGGKAVDLDHDG